MCALKLAPDQARKFCRDGYLRMPGVVPDALVSRARRLLFGRMGELRRAAARAVSSGDTEALAEISQSMGRSGGSDVIMDLFNATSIKSVVESAFGAEVVPLRGAQVVTRYPADDDLETNEAGYQNVDTPHFGWCGHLDGLWNGGLPTPAAGSVLTQAEARLWNAEQSTNSALKYFPEFNTNIANYTALVGVALSDQRASGAGNLGLLRGGHRHMETFFRWQRDRGGPLGPEGPGWPRENTAAPNGHGLVHYPERVRNKYRRGAVQSSDGMAWPKPTLMKIKAGDAILVHHATPHSASRVMTSDPRLMIYFRCVTATRPEKNRTVYPEALCDIWLEWPGLKRLCRDSLDERSASGA